MASLTFFTITAQIRNYRSTDASTDQFPSSILIKLKIGIISILRIMYVLPLLAVWYNAVNDVNRDEHGMLYMAPVTSRDRYAESVDFWRNVYGIDMSPTMQVAKCCAFEVPSVETISGENVLTRTHLVKHVDCYAVTEKEAESVTSNFKFQSMIGAPFHGFAFWFDVMFGGSGSYRRKRASPDDAPVLSTAPEDPPTHWQQTMVYFYDPIDVEQDQVIYGGVTITQCLDNFRCINIHL
ncbi:putative protein arginine N-methyltransferase 6 [Bidens hawaiensis]|uniref:putative protein arginine N-methyltransferase 6 n=1 Tax=Bidens hawaiensis TaxID=980011 RepID=UPI004049A16B